MSSVNKAILVGNLGADPESRSMTNGGKVCHFRIATSEQWKDRDTREKRERTEWHSIVIFNEALVEVAERYLRKGSKVYVEGQLSTRKWTDQQGVERYSTEIVLKAFNAVLVLLDRAQQDPGRHDYGGHDDGGRPARAPATGSTARKPDPFDSDLDDDIPF